MPSFGKSSIWFKLAGYPVLFFLALLFTAHYAFPYGRLEDKFRDAVAESYDVEEATFKPGLFPGDVVIRDIVLKSRPDGHEKPVEIFVDKVKVDVGVLALLRKRVDVDIVAEIGDGRLEARVLKAKEGVLFHVDTEAFPLSAIPGASALTGGAPLQGGLTAKLDLRLLGGEWKKANGSVDLRCVECVLVKGTKLMPVAARQRDAFTSAGFTLPASIILGEFGGRLEIKKGKGEFKDFSAQSPDGELHLEGNISFADPVGKSRIQAYLRLKFSQTLKLKDPRMEDIERMSLGAAKRPDGFYGIRMKGMLEAPVYRASKINPLDAAKRGDQRVGKNRAARRPVRKPSPKAPARPGTAGAAGRSPAGDGAAGEVVPATRRGPTDPDRRADPDERPGGLTRPTLGNRPGRGIGKLRPPGGSPDDVGRGGDPAEEDDEDEDDDDLDDEDEDEEEDDDEDEDDGVDVEMDDEDDTAPE